MIIQSTTLDTEEKVIRIYGGTSWTKIEGRMLIGADSKYIVNSTGGSATHKILTSEMPSHTHTFSGTSVTSGNESAGHTHSVGAHSHGLNSHTHSIPSLNGTAISAGGHSHRLYGSPNTDSTNTVSFNSALVGNQYFSVGGMVEPGGEHSHSVITNASTSGKASGSTANSKSFNSGGVSAKHTHSVTAKGSNSNTGGGQAMNIMNPYKAVYIWERTA